MKTVLQELIEYSRLVGFGFDEDIIKEYLEKEEQQIKNAWIHGAVRSPLKLKHINNPQGYFDSTFGESNEAVS